MQIELPYGRGKTTLECPDDELKAVLTSRLHELKSEGSEAQLVLDALENPIGSPRLRDLAAGKQRILVITSDHTRPVPSKITMPLLLQELRSTAPQAEIRLLIATGVHRGTTKEELCGKFGEEIVERETICIHDAFAKEDQVFKGELPSGCKLSVNRLVDWAELVVAEGFIEPHFFAGFSGGRKSILPGIASAVSVMSNHCSQLIADPHSRTGILEGNPIHRDMVAASRLAGLSFILNVVIDAEKRIVKAYAGHPEKAHEAGCAFVGEMCRVEKRAADIVITTNGGYPLDQNVYQSVKSMTAAEVCVNPGGVVICVSQCGDGSGGEEFYKWFHEASGPADVMGKIMKIPAEATIGDQWQAQILARVMLRARVIIVADEKARETVEGMGMFYSSTVNQALAKAKELKPDYDGIVVIPDGVSVILDESQERK